MTLAELKRHHECVGKSIHHLSLPWLRRTVHMHAAVICLCGVCICRREKQERNARNASHILPGGAPLVVSSLLLGAEKMPLHVQICAHRPRWLTHLVIFIGQSLMATGWHGVSVYYLRQRTLSGAGQTRSLTPLLRRLNNSNDRKLECHSLLRGVKYSSGSP